VAEIPPFPYEAVRDEYMLVGFRYNGPVFETCVGFANNIHNTDWIHPCKVGCRFANLGLRPRVGWHRRILSGVMARRRTP